MNVQLSERGGRVPRLDQQMLGVDRIPDDASPAARIDVQGVSRRLAVHRRDHITVLSDVSFTVAPGELIAIVGPSGAGKTMLLETMSGVGPATSGSVLYDGANLHANLRTFRGAIGYVPQDDIIHADLPLRHTLRYAARLRLPSSAGTVEIDEAVQNAIDTVGLNEQAEVRVGALSGGQRKRASIAVELLTQPRAFFLDEPTSSLDPAASAQLISHLRRMAGRSATVVFTTHSTEDLAHCDRIVFMSRGGRVGFVGTIDEALEQFEVNSLQDLYLALAEGSQHVPTSEPADPAPTLAATDAIAGRRPISNGFTQWRVLTRRTLETYARNPLTLAILLGSPVLVVGMFAILFRPGAFDSAHPSPSSMVMIGFWVVFAAFFFGLTYGLLQICTEQTILRRERLVGLRLGAYVASKVTVLVPFLSVVIVAMLGVLRLMDRLPSRPLSTYSSMATTLLLCAIAALSLGLLTSASVGNVAQATLALPLLCFPAVLFAGAVLPVHLMAGAGATLSIVMPTRWAFDAIGHDLGARQILADGGSPLGPPLLASFGNAGQLSTPTYWLILTSFVVVFLLATWWVLVHATAKSTR